MRARLDRMHERLTVTEGCFIDEWPETPERFLIVRAAAALALRAAEVSAQTTADIETALRAALDLLWESLWSRCDIYDLAAPSDEPVRIAPYLHYAAVAPARPSVILDAERVTAARRAVARAEALPPETSLSGPLHRFMLIAYSEDTRNYRVEHRRSLEDVSTGLTRIRNADRRLEAVWDLGAAETPVRCDVRGVAEVEIDGALVHVETP